MLILAENLLEKYFESISIDNKVEFLVAAKICNFHSRLFEKIQLECQNNFSISTGFIREPRKSLEKQNISNSEHRNVLYIMSNISPYFQATKKI